MSASLTDNKRAFYIAQLGLSAAAGAKMSLADLESAFFANPPSGTYATVATSGLASDLSGTLSIEQAAPRTIVGVPATGTTWPGSNPTARTDIILNYIGSDAAHPPALMRAGDLWDYAS